MAQAMSSNEVACSTYIPLIMIYQGGSRAAPTKPCTPITSQSLPAEVHEGRAGSRNGRRNHPAQERS